jgi:hypothetical protein
MPPTPTGGRRTLAATMLNGTMPDRAMPNGTMPDRAMLDGMTFDRTKIAGGAPPAGVKRRGVTDLRSSNTPGQVRLQFQ